MSSSTTLQESAHNFDDDNGREPKDRDANAHGYMAFDVLFDPSLSWRGKVVFGFCTTFAGPWTLKIEGHKHGLRSALGLGRDTAYEGLDDYRKYRRITRPRDERNRFVECTDDEPPRPAFDASFKVWRCWFDGFLSAHALFLLLLTAALCRQHGRAYVRELKELSGFARDRIKSCLAELETNKLVERIGVDEYHIEKVDFVAEKSGTGISGNILRNPIHELSPLSMDLLSPRRDEKWMPSSPNGDEGRAGDRISLWDVALGERVLAGWMLHLDLDAYSVFPIEDDMAAVRDAMSEEELLRHFRQATGGQAASHLSSRAGLEVLRALAAKILETGIVVEISSLCAPRLALGMVLQAFDDRIGLRGESITSFEIVGSRILHQLYENSCATRFFEGGSDQRLLLGVMASGIAAVAQPLLEQGRIDLYCELDDGINWCLRQFGMGSTDAMFAEIARLKLSGFGGEMGGYEVCDLLAVSVKAAQNGGSDETRQSRTL